MRNTLFVAFIFLFVACNKEPMPATSVLLRIHNETNQNFTQVLTSNENFSNVDANSTSGYQSFFQILSMPSCTLISGTDTSYAGHIPIDNPTFITTGKYTLEIKTDTTTVTGYSCEYKEE
jgi:hypothetical protein